jgi:hypothetical protein
MSETLRRDPTGEAQRLAALERYDILDTPPEATFGRVVGSSSAATHRNGSAPIYLLTSRSRSSSARASRDGSWS